MNAGAHLAAPPPLAASRAFSTAAGEAVHQEVVRQGQVKHAIKTALACCVAIYLALLCGLQSPQLAPVLAFLLMTTGMPRPGLNWLVTQLAVGISSVVCAFALVLLAHAPVLSLVATLLWIFTCILFTRWFPFAATYAALVAAIALFVAVRGSAGATLSFLVNYSLNWVVAGFSGLLVHTLLWPSNTQDLFLQRLADVYAHLEARCQGAAEQLLSGGPPLADASPHEWAPFRPLRQLIAPGAWRTGGPSNPFVEVMLASRSLDLRLWFVSQVLAPAITRSLPPEARRPLAILLQRIGGHLHQLFEGVTNRRQVAAVDRGLLGEFRALAGEIGGPQSAGQDVLLAHRAHELVLRRAVEELDTLTGAHNVLLRRLGHGPSEELISSRPVSTSAPLLDPSSIHAGVKLVIMLLLLVVEETVFRFPGGSQVAFFATFFASTSNLGRQNKTDLIGLTGLLAGFAFGLVAAFLTSHLPQAPLMLLLVFLGEFLASLAFQRVPRYAVASVQAGLALPFAYLVTRGPGFGSYEDVRVRFWGLVVAGLTAVVVHAYLWPVLPIRRLRESIATALRQTAVRLRQLFERPDASWEGPPPSLGETVLHAPELLDDARYLPGADPADTAYPRILADLQHVDANLEYVHLLLEQEADYPICECFFGAVGDYRDEAKENLDWVARQFEEPAGRAALLGALRWEPDASSRWERASLGVVALDPTADTRTETIARCLDQIATAIQEISGAAQEINRKSTR